MLLRRRLATAFLLALVLMPMSAVNSLAAVKEPYLVPLLDDATPEASEAAYRIVLERVDFTFFDDRRLYLDMMERIFTDDSNTAYETASTYSDPGQ